MNYALNTFTCRQVGVTGSVIYFCGSFLTAFATNVYQIIFTYGIMQGIGLGLMVPAAFTNFNYYFVRRRTFAMAVTQMIIGVAAMIVPLAIQMLLEEYGFRGTQAIIAAFSLHAMLGMVVQQPVKYHVRKKKHSTELSSDIKPRPSADIIVHGEGMWKADVEKSREVNIRIQQYHSEVGKDSEVNIQINKHSELKAIKSSRAISQELINIQFQNKNMCVGSSDDGNISVGLVNESKHAGVSNDFAETESGKQKHEYDSAKMREEHVNSDSNVSDEHKFLMQSGHSKKYGHVEQVTAEIGITVKRADTVSAVTRTSRSGSQVSVPGMDKMKDVYRMRYDSIRDAPSLGGNESQDG